GQALAKQGVNTRISRVPWFDQGWLRSLWNLWREAAAWQGSWVLIQHTALAWSRHGFPTRVLAVVEILRRRNVRCGIVFHDPRGVSGPRAIDQVRCGCQNWVVRQLHRRTVRSIFADPLNRMCWLKANDSKAFFIPIGANIPESIHTPSPAYADRAKRTVAVFCLSTQPNVYRELDDISSAVRAAAESGLKVRVLFVGRGTAEARDEIARIFRHPSIEVANLGVRSSDEVSRALGESDVMLCVRGPLNPRRGSAIAGIACGLPVIAYEGAAAGTPLERAGIVLVPYQDKAALGCALVQVLRDPSYWKELHSRSIQAQTNCFSWDTIAPALASALDLDAV